MMRTHSEEQISSFYNVIVSFSNLSHLLLFVAPWIIACQPPLSYTLSWGLLKTFYIESVMLTISSSATPFSSHLQSFIESRSFPMVSSSHQVAKVLELQLQHQYSQWNSVLISFRIDWFDLLSVQWTLKSFLQCHSSKASTPQHSAILWSSSHIHTWLLEKP